MNRRLFSRSRVLTMACLLFAGCAGGDAGNPSVSATTGIVTYQGKPVAGATVTFIQPGAPRSGVGVTNAEGRFVISTLGNNDGALIGDHVVTIIKKSANAVSAEPYRPSTDLMEMAKKSQAVQEKPADTEGKADELPAKYANPEISGLKAIVSKDPKSNDFKFELVD